MSILKDKCNNRIHISIINMFYLYIILYVYFMYSSRESMYEININSLNIPSKFLYNNTIMK